MGVLSIMKHSTTLTFTLKAQQPVTHEFGEKKMDLNAPGVQAGKIVIRELPAQPPSTSLAQNPQPKAP